MLDCVHSLCGARMLLVLRTLPTVMATLVSPSSCALGEAVRTILRTLSTGHGNIGFFEHSIEDHNGDGGPPLLQQRDRLALRGQRDLEDGIEDVRAGSSAVAGESSGIIGLRQVSESDSSLHISRVTNSLNSSVGVDMSACARAACALPGAAAPHPCSTVARLSDVVVAHAHASPMHRARNSGGTGGLLPVQRSTSYCLENSWSDTVRVQGPTGTKRGQRWGFQSGRRFAPCLRGGGRGKFSAGRRCTGAGCRFTSQEATRHGYQARSGEVRSHLPSTRKFLVSNSCHLDTDWTSDNQSAGRRCVDTHGRGSGC